VILDGKPIGKSPKRALSVPAGSHSVVFVHPTLGRKRASAKLAPGGSKTIAVKF
jgi:serine/threonine-protein kinase